MKTHIISIFLMLAPLIALGQNPQQGDHFLYCHMSDRGEWTAYAVSRDGLHYEDILGGLAIFNTEEHALIEGGTRDAYITRRHDGNGFLMVTTDMCVARSHKWDNYGINLHTSTDLTHWKSVTFDFRQGPKIFCDKKSKNCYKDFSKVHRVWAPQIFWDPTYRWADGHTGGYLIYYSMLNDDEDHYDRMYYSYADESFTRLTKPQLLFDWGYATIDADINYLESDHLYHMLIKKEGGKPGIYTATAPSLTGPWSEPVEDDYVSFEGTKKCEGSSAFQIPGEQGWRVAYIQYSDRPKHYRICEADEHLRNFRNPQDIQGVTGPQHGSFMRITEEEYLRLKAWSDSLMTHPRKVNINVANPTGNQRQQVVEMDLKPVRQRLGISYYEPFVVLNSAGQQLDYQKTADDKVVFEVSVQPRQTASFTIQRGFPKEPQSTVQGRQYPIRKDDLAWENDRAAYRLYGPALQQTGERSFGIDVWTKSTPRLVLDQRYKADYEGNLVEDSLRRIGQREAARQVDLTTSFHMDHGDGMDAYAVGPTLGCGAPALMAGDSLIMPWCYERVRILDNGPLRFTAELDYPAVSFASSSQKGNKAPSLVTEHRRITLDKGSHFNRMTVWYDGLSAVADAAVSQPSASSVRRPFSFATGVVLHGGDPVLTDQSLLYADPTDTPLLHQSQIFVGCLFPNGVERTFVHKSPDGKTRHALATVANYRGEPYTYWFGSAWSKAGVTSMQEWQLRSEAHLDQLRHPLLIATVPTASIHQPSAITQREQRVLDIIARVNATWQRNHPAEVRAFWDNAAYHTANIEVYKLTQEPQWLDYSVRWANYNHWQGAREKDPAKWKYKQYGEGHDFVLFGDWQICFQTYIDLFNIYGQQPAHEIMVERAREVMGHEARSPQNDYWWWADALYMVMPVMTKMYRLTGDDIYLEKLYQNLCYSDSIMLDNETGLYFRDGKYVYPKHQSANHRKDFWARGDGWVLAGLAKVLQDMPENHRHRRFFVEKYQRMAAAVAALQQPEGYWTRSMMDPDHAPGPETSGTAFFTYGLLWGINNHLLAKEDYQDVVARAWNYLSTTALQPDGRIGYVQPIGERAIPGQTVNQHSEAPFGTGAFLLAACEYARYVR